VLKLISKTTTLLLLLAAATVQAQVFSTAKNPRVDTTLVPGTSFANMGLAFLSDGRMLILGASIQTSGQVMGQGVITAADGNQALYLVSGLSRTGSLAGVTVTKILDSLTGPPPGVVVVNDTVYVQDRNAFYRVKSLNPTGGTAKAKNAVRIIKAPTLDSTFVWLRGESGHQWVFTPVYHNGRFYAPYSGSIRSGGHSNAPPTSTYSGAMLSWSKDSIIPDNAPANAGFTKVAGGIRSPNGMASNGEYMLFTDNQGSFNPGTPFRLFKPGQPLVTYGTRQSTTANASGVTLESPVNTLRNWAEDLPYQPPLVWIPYDPLKSGAQPVYMTSGAYKGHWLVTDVNANGMGRVFVDNVDGTNYQGSFTMFSGTNTNGSKAVIRMAVSPDSALYLGTMLNIGNWPSGAANPVIRMTLKDTAVFEILAMRSRKSPSGDTNGVELFFSQPVDPATFTTSTFSVQQQNYSLGANYGCNSILCQNKTPVVTGFTISSDKRKVFVGISTPDTSIGAAHVGTIGVGNNPRGMWGGPGAQDRTLRITLGTGVRSEAGTSLYYSSIWMGWHFQSAVKFDPANTDLTPVALAGRTPEVSRLASAVTLQSLAGGLNVRVAVPGRVTVGVYTINGVLREEQTGTTGNFRFNTTSYGRGMHIVRVKTATTAYTRALLF
jgi:hypothetical protein